MLAQCLGARGMHSHTEYIYKEAYLQKSLEIWTRREWKSDIHVLYSNSNNPSKVLRAQ